MASGRAPRRRLVEAQRRAVAVTPQVRSRVLGRGRDHAATERAVLVLRDVTKVYPNGKTALEEVDLVIPEGDFVFLVGPSGAGNQLLSLSAPGDLFWM